MLGVKDEEKPAGSEVMESEQVIFLDAGDLKKSKKVLEDIEKDNEDVEMSSDDENVVVDSEGGKKRVFNTKTLKDQNGQYPVWLHKRKIAKINKDGKKKQKKRIKKRKK